jgi:hypothetical protein
MEQRRKEREAELERRAREARMQVLWDGWGARSVVGGEVLWEASCYLIASG